MTPQDLVTTENGVYRRSLCMLPYLHASLFLIDETRASSRTRMNASDSTEDPRIGQILFGYKVIREVGRGAMGIVYEAHNSAIGQRAAVKVLSSSGSGSSKQSERLLSEARAASAVPHSGIVKIFNGGQLPSGEAFLIMEFLDGESLQARLDRLYGEKKRLATEDVARVGAEIASALAAVHQRNIVHRDLKPANLLLVPESGAPGGERVRIVDFGIAKFVEDETTASTAQLGLVGTARYASPEQFGSDHKVGPHSDVYSMGVILFELVCGEVPFSGSQDALRYQHLKKEAPSLKRLAPSCPDALQNLVHQMLAKEPSVRPSMGEVATRLRSLFQPAERSSSSLAVRTRWALAIFGGAALVGAVAIGIDLVRHPAKSDVPAHLDAGPTHHDAPNLPTVDINSARAKALATLLEGLRERDVLLRLRAAHGLSRLAEPTTRPWLLPLLQDPDIRVQVSAVRALDSLRTGASRKAIQEALDKSASPQVQLAALESLLDQGMSDTNGRLNKLLSSQDPEVRQQAMILFALRGDSAIRTQVHRLIPTLPTDVQASVLGRLARHGDRLAQEMLRKMLPPVLRRDGELLIAEELLSSGEELGRTALEACAKSNDALKLRAARVLAEHDDPSYFDLFREVLRPERALSERLLAVEGMGASRIPRGVPILYPLLMSQESPLRLRLATAEAILLSSQLDPDRMQLNVLLWAEQALADSRWTVRAQATTPLADAQPHFALPLLAKAIRDSQPEVRQSAAASLGRTKSKDAIPLLRGVLDDRVGPVRREALHSLGSIGNHLRKQGESVDGLATELTSRRKKGDVDDQLSTVGALASLGDETAVLELQGQLKSSFPEVRFSAARMLAERGHKEAIPELQTVATGTGPRAVQASLLLQRLGEKSKLDLRSLLTSSNSRTRVDAVAALGQLPFADALSLFRITLSDSSPQVRDAMVSALATHSLSGVDASLAMLRLLARDRDAQVRSHAAMILLRALPSAQAEKQPQRAAAAYLSGETKDLLNRAIETPAALMGELDAYVTTSAACADKKQDLARVLFAKVTDMAARKRLIGLCLRDGVALSQTAQELLITDDDLKPEPTPPLAPIGVSQGGLGTGQTAQQSALPVPAVVPSTPVKPERQIRNKEIRLPKKVTDAIPPPEQLAE